MTPIFVETLWSEAGGELDKHQVWNFEDFEKAAHEAEEGYTSSGYLKTKVNVLMSDGSRTQIRLDLQKNGDHGVKSYVDSVLKHIATSTGRDYMATAPKGEQEFIEHIKRIQFTQKENLAAA